MDNIIFWNWQWKNIEIKKETLFSTFTGLIYSAFTYYIGFKVNSGEYKLMGLAPYGEPKYENLIKKKLLRYQTMEVSG